MYTVLCMKQITDTMVPALHRSSRVVLYFYLSDQKKQIKQTNIPFCIITTFFSSGSLRSLALLPQLLHKDPRILLFCCGGKKEGKEESRGMRRIKRGGKSGKIDSFTDERAK